MTTPRARAALSALTALTALAALALAAGCDDGATATADTTPADDMSATDGQPLDDMRAEDMGAEDMAALDMAPDMAEPLPDLGPPPPAPFQAADLIGTWASAECEPSNGEFLLRQLTLGDGDYTLAATVFDTRGCSDPLFSFVHHGTWQITSGSHLGEDIAQATFRLQQNLWTLLDPVFEMAFEINMCGSDMWDVGVAQDIAETGCLQFAYPIGTCPGGELDLIQLADGLLTTGVRSGDLCAERAPALDDYGALRLPDAVEIDAPTFYPEGVAVGPDRALYTGALTTGEIRRAALGEATAQTLVAPGALGGAALGMKIHDDALWVCATDLAAYVDTALVQLDPTTGAERARYPFPGGGICNDLTFADDGTAYVTESSSNAIMRLPPGADALDAWFTGEALPPVGPSGFGFNGLIIDDDGSLLVGRADDGTLTRVPVLDDGTPGDPTIEAVEPAAITLGIDGLQRWRYGYYAVRDSQLVELIPGDPWTTRVIAAGDDFPTTIAIDAVGNAWTAESKFGLLFDGDDATDAEPPFRLIRHPLY